MRKNLNEIKEVPRRGFACVYKLTIGDKIYIGSTSNLRQRLTGHRSNYRTPVGLLIQEAGHENVFWEVLKELKQGDPLYAWERAYVEDAMEQGQNLINSSTPAHIVFSDELRNKVVSGVAKITVEGETYVYGSSDIYIRAYRLLYDSRSGKCKFFMKIKDAALVKVELLEEVETNIGERTEAWIKKLQPSLNESYKGMLETADLRRKRINETGSPQRPVRQLTKKGLKFIREWSSVQDAAEALETHQSNIVACCKGRRKSCCGYSWSYV